MDAPPYSAAAVDVLRLPAGTTEPDRVAVEEPLEIRIGGRAVAVTMRTPGHDEELALGFCLSEGLQPSEARLPGDLAANTVDVDAPGFDPGRLQRSFYTSSSCGVCGKGALEAVAVEAPRVESELRLPLLLVASLPDRLREAQAAFAVTGGLKPRFPKLTAVTRYGWGIRGVLAASAFRSTNRPQKVSWIDRMPPATRPLPWVHSNLTADDSHCGPITMSESARARTSPVACRMPRSRFTFGSR